MYKFKMAPAAWQQLRSRMTRRELSPMPHQLTDPPAETHASTGQSATTPEQVTAWISHAVDQLPGGVVTIAAATLAAALLVAVLRSRSRAAQLARASARLAPRSLADAGPLALLGACGMLVSLYGLWGFARQTAQLPIPLAAPFLAIFDLAEVTSFISLYRSAAAGATTWTTSMRRTRRMAWMLVGASAAMNAAHAPHHWVARIVLAAVPVVSARLIEHELDKRLSLNAGSEEGTAQPGPVQLVRLGYAHLWARIFARLGLDVSTADGTIQQSARIRRAAAQIHALGKAHDEASRQEADPQAKPRHVQRSRARVEKWEARAQRAIDLAGLAGDTPAQLTLARCLATRGRVIDLATMDVRDPLAMMELMEQLAIVPSAKAIAAGSRAAAAEKRRQAAEAACEDAERRQHEAEQAAAAIEQEAARLLVEARAEREAAAAESDQRQQLADDIARLHTERSRHQADQAAHDAELQQLAEQRRQAAEETRKASEKAATARQEAAEAQEERRTALVALQTAREDILSALTNPAGTAPPNWRSTRKLRGWEIYETWVGQYGAPPTAPELARVTGADRTTAQHWLNDFATELARRTAATLPGQHTRTAPDDTTTTRTPGLATVSP
jgi:hypothetical protein